MRSEQASRHSGFGSPRQACQGGPSVRLGISARQSPDARMQQAHGFQDRSACSEELTRDLRKLSRSAVTLGLPGHRLAKLSRHAAIHAPTASSGTTLGRTDEMEEHGKLGPTTTERGEIRVAAGQPSRDLPEDR